MTNVIITRPLELALPLQETLTHEGVDSLIYPAIEIEPLAMDVTISFMDYYVFISRNAVIHGIDLLPRNSKTIAIGKGTYDALKSAGFTPELIPEKPFTSEQLLAQPNLPLNKTHHVAIMKGVGGRATLCNELQKIVASISTINVYQRKIAQPSSALQADYLTTLVQGCTAIFVNSVETLDNLIQLTPETNQKQLKQQQLLTGSTRVLDAIQSAGFVKPAWLADSTTDQDMIKTFKMHS